VSELGRNPSRYPEFNPMHEIDKINPDAWSDKWWVDLVAMDQEGGEYEEVERLVAADLGLRPAVRDVDAQDLIFAMDLLRLIGSQNPYEADAKSVIERYQYEEWGRLQQLARLFGRQLVRKTLDDAHEYVARRIENERAGTDYLTGVANRRRLDERLEDLYGITDDPVRRNRDGEPLDPIRLGHGYGDINRFKRINDTLGHHIGDAAIIEAAWEIEDMFRGSEELITYRHGGDEFGVILEDISDEEARRLTHRIFTTQAEKARSPQHRQAVRAVMDRVQSVRASGQRLRTEALMRTLSPDEIAAGQRPYHMLYINGEPVTELRNIITLAAGARGALVSNLDDVEALRRYAEDSVRGAQGVMRDILDEIPYFDTQQNSR
jgi:diguanylate cyclase (GGDEF)-like protein